MTNRQRLFVAAGLVVSAVFLVVAFRNLNPEAVIAHVRSINPLPLLVAAVWYFAAVVMISMRWQFLMRAIKLVSLRHLIPLVSICYMGNNVYPLRSGEILRVVLLQRNHGVPIARGGTVAFVERIFDGLVMVTFLLIPLALLNVTSPEVRTVASLTAPLFLGGIVLFLVLAARPNLLRRVAGFFARFLPGRLRDLALSLTEEVIAGLGGLRSPGDLAGTLLFSYGGWALEATVYWLVSFAFALDVDYLTMLLVVSAVNLGGLIPSSPGQFGVFEFFVITALTAVGINAEVATAYALVVHLVVWLPVTVVGFFFLARQGLSLRAVTRARELESQAAAS